MANSVWSHGLQHARLLWSLLSPGACSNSGPLSWWCRPTISSSVVPFSSCPQSFSASGSFLISRLFPSGDQSIGASASASFLPILISSNDYSGLIFFRIDWFDLAVHKTLKSLLQHHSEKAPIFWQSAFFIFQLTHPYVTIGKTIALTRQTFVSKVMALLFNMLSN